MTPFQKIIKYGAIAFAMYLSFVIISVTVGVITAIFGITVGIEKHTNDTVTSQTMIEQWSEEYTDVTNLDVDLDFSKLEIKEGTTLKVETRNVSDRFECKMQSNKLIIKDSAVDSDWYKLQDITPEVIIYIPKDYKFNDVTIKTKINETKIYNLESEKLELEMGTGKYEIDRVIAKNAEIESGAGEVIIRDSEFEKLKLDGGIGKLSITSKITNNADIDSGVGQVEVNLIGNKEDYKIRAETGLGNLLVDGNSVANNQTVYDGNVTIDVEAGVGETEINIINGSI